MILPCVDCLKLPICIEKNISDLTPSCKPLKNFTKTRRGLTGLIRNDDEFKTTLKVKQSSPYIYIEPVN